MTQRTLEVNNPPGIKMMKLFFGCDLRKLEVRKMVWNVEEPKYPTCVS